MKKTKNKRKAETSIASVVTTPISVTKPVSFFSLFVFVYRDSVVNKRKHEQKMKHLSASFVVVFIHFLC